jgi:hypothetical protein
MTEEELVAIVTSEMKDLATSLVAADYTNAVYSATLETTFTLPNTTNEQIYWLKERTKRHLIFMLATGAAAKFQVKQIKLDQKYRNLKDLYTSMDETWEKMQDDMLQSTIDPVSQFGIKADAGFSYDPVTGEDTTYEDSNFVIITR